MREFETDDFVFVVCEGKDRLGIVTKRIGDYYLVDILELGEKFVNIDNLKEATLNEVANILSKELMGLLGDFVKELSKEEHNEDKQKPHFEFFGNCLGVIGKPTNYRDKHGNKLCVGDVVRVKNRNHEDITFVVEDNEDGQFIMGIQVSCKDGKIKNYEVELVTRYTNLDVVKDEYFKEHKLEVIK